MSFKKFLNNFITCEIHRGGEVNCLAKLENGNWVAVKADGSLDWVEISAQDLESMLESLKEAGANIRFTNHSAA